MKLVIKGDVPSQKNRKIISINRATGRPFLRSAPAVKEWQVKANIVLRHQFKGLKTTNYPISIVCSFFFSNNRRRDLDNGLNGVMDALVAAEIIKDDSVEYVDCITIQYGGVDKKNPRVEIFLDE